MKSVTSVMSIRKKFRKSTDKKGLDMDPALGAGANEESLQGNRLAAIRHCKRLLGTLTRQEDIDSVNFVIHVLGEGETNKFHRKNSLTREFRRRGTDAAVQEYILKNVVAPSHQGDGVFAPQEENGFFALVSERLTTFRKERATLPVASVVISEPLKSTLLGFIAQKVDPQIRLPPENHANVGDEVFEVMPLVESPEIDKIMANLSSWFEFDVLELNRITNGRPLVHVCIHLLRKYNLFETLKLDYDAVLVTLTAVESCYTDTNPYHNRTHAADVVQSLNALLVESGILEMFSPTQLFSAIIAGAIHDVDHPGMTNSLMINLETDVAITYNSKSILESHHLATFFRIARHPKCNMFANFTPKEKTQIKSIIVEMVLGTDMMLHADMLDDFKTKIESEELVADKVPSEYEIPLLRMALHVADVSNPAKRPNVCFEWADRIMEEFFMQGDLERYIKSIAPSKECDRLTAKKHRVQIGFIEFILRPLFEAWASLYPQTSPIVEQLRENVKLWEQQA